MSPKNYVLIRVWLPRGINGLVTSMSMAMLSKILGDPNVGHISLTICSEGELTYISHWPKETAGFKDVVAEKNNLAGDIRDEGNNPDYYVRLYGLDVKQMLARYVQIREKAAYKLAGMLSLRTGETKVDRNCASFAYDLLVAGGFEVLLKACSLAGLSGLLTPDEVGRLAFSLKAHTVDCDGLLADGMFAISDLYDQNAINRTLKEKYSLKLLRWAGAGYHEKSVKKAIRIFMKGNPTLETTDERGYNALHLAVESGNYDLAKVILEKFPGSVSLPIKPQTGVATTSVFDLTSNEKMLELLRSSPQFSFVSLSKGSAERHRISLPSD
eukprot:TRINITY_DN4219_c0_g1_i2.p1 TRINITY_DN4219_c0_g1~~TRINITY_DN4219_c0_g1_i2.p1  ORF type:complete len:327 (-),score=67.87 TRINITY_DN4219_c0_g1_i2:525-1505(-)